MAGEEPSKFLEQDAYERNKLRADVALMRELGVSKWHNIELGQVPLESLEQRLAKASSLDEREALLDADKRSQEATARESRLEQMRTLLAATGVPLSDEYLERLI